jgi:murein DD-endopeptidase MepM/ murein hydrolase activator NlpD
MPTFPLPFRPELSYKTGGRKFGAGREGGGRKHAACDLVVPKGTEIYAVEDGEVIRGPKHFYHGTDAIEFKLTDGRIVRYCEIKGVPQGVQVGTKLKEGDVIAYVGKMYKDSMLHFELYDGTATGKLTNRSNKPYERRKDLIDPTDYLDSCTLKNVLTTAPQTETAALHLPRLPNIGVPVRWIV